MALIPSVAPVSDARIDGRTTPVFNIDRFGATADGSGDNTQAVLAAMAASKDAGGGTIWLPQPVDYLCETIIAAPGIPTILYVNQDNITFDGVPGSGLKTTQAASLMHLSGASKVLDILNWTSGWLHGGNDTPTLPPEAISSASEGAMSVTLTTHAHATNYPVGAILYIRTGHTLGAAITASTQPKAEMNIVTSSDASTGVLGLKWPLSRDYAVENYPVGHPLAGTPTPFGVVNATDYVIQNVAFKNIRLISTYDVYSIMPEGQVIGLFMDNLHVESAGGFQALNNVRNGRYRNCDVHLNGPASDYNWFYTTATGTTDVQIINPASTCTTSGTYHIHEGTVDCTISGGITRNAPGLGGSETTISVRGYNKHISVLNHRLIGAGTGAASLYVDSTCDGGVIDGVVADGPIGVGGSNFKLGPNNKADTINVYNDLSGGPIADGVGPSQLLQVSGWVSDANDTQILGKIPGPYLPVSIRVIVTEAFNGLPDNYINVGIVGNQYSHIYAFPCGTTGDKTGTGTLANMGYRSNAETMKAYYVGDSGTPATTGKALVIFEAYNVPGQVLT